MLDALNLKVEFLSLTVVFPLCGGLFLPRGDVFLLVKDFDVRLQGVLLQGKLLLRYCQLNDLQLKPENAVFDDLPRLRQVLKLLKISLLLRCGPLDLGRRRREGLVRLGRHAQALILNEVEGAATPSLVCLSCALRQALVKHAKKIGPRVIIIT